jgi:hypothetical protein
LSKQKINIWNKSAFPFQEMERRSSAEQPALGFVLAMPILEGKGLLL